MKRYFKISFALLTVITLVLGFALPLNPVGNWYQQFFPNLNNKPISDVYFLDSLNGWAVTNTGMANDSAYILKTTNGGDNWNIIYYNKNNFTKIKFINQNTGYTTGVTPFIGASSINKSTNGGLNWFMISPPDPFFTLDDISILNTDTIWVAAGSLSSGGVFFTSNGGASWQVQYQGNNPNKIYMFDRNMGFISPPTLGALYRTTNSGVNWVQISGADGFNDIQFINNLTGWKASGFIRKTTDGGLNWVQQTIPSGGIITSSSIRNIHVLNSDTAWGVGGAVQYPNLQSRGIIYRTINGGQNWLFQIPDTSFQILGPYSYIQFVNSKTGWAYTIGVQGGIHTTIGGDTGWVTGVIQISSEVPKEFRLHQNYPNPFNPATNIKYQIINTAYVKLAVYDITGKEITILVNKEQRAGIYQTDFEGSKYSTGVYFYQLTVTTAKEVFRETKRMILVK